MKINQTRPGYILVLTLLMISISLLIVSKLAQQSGIQYAYDRTIVERIQAQNLATSGLHIAMSQLAYPEQKDEKKQVDKNLLLLKQLLPNLNTWQEFVLTKEADGVEGTIGISILSEDGKIDINSLYNFEEEKFASDAVKKWMQQLFQSLVKFVDGKKLFEEFEKFLKKRDYKIEDVTELLSNPQFAEEFGNVFYMPPDPKKKDEKRPVYLTDIFTVQTGAQQISAWVLSDSLCALLGLKRADTRSSQSQKKDVQEISNAIKSTSDDLKKAWQAHLGKLYGKDITTIPKELQQALTTSLSFRNFTVVSYGRVNETMQYVVALLERAEDDIFMIKRLYWK